MCQLFDRGIFTLNQMLDVWGQPHVEDGDKRYIRKEYTEFNNLDKDVIDNGTEDEESGTENSESTDEGNINSEEKNQE